MKKILICLLALLLACAPCLASAEGLLDWLGGLFTGTETAQNEFVQDLIVDIDPVNTTMHVVEPAITVEIDVAGYGVITAELYPDEAPITVANFVKLAREGFYDGLTFHRIISGFMIQGGDPNGNGTGGSSETIKGEFISNGVDNDLPHDRGVLSMARSSAPDSASSQFFIMQEAAPHLDGYYAAFGKVISGMEVVDAICANTPVQDWNGTVAKADQPVITSIRVIEDAAE